MWCFEWVVDVEGDGGAWFIVDVGEVASVVGLEDDDGFEWAYGVVFGGFFCIFVGVFGFAGAWVPGLDRWVGAIVCAVFVAFDEDFVGVATWFFVVDDLVWFVSFGGFDGVFVVGGDFVGFDVDW